MMAKYVDGFVLPLPKKNLEQYRKVARLASKVWIEHGALEYRECMLEDGKPGFGLPFAKLTKAKPSETVMFSFIVYKSRKHRDKVNAKAMNDPRLKMEMDKMPFDVNLMSWGGFEMIVDA